MVKGAYKVKMKMVVLLDTLKDMNLDRKKEKIFIATISLKITIIIITITIHIIKIEEGIKET